MGAGSVGRDDIEAAELQRLARCERDGLVSARLLAIAGVLDGRRHAAAARAAGLEHQTLRDWVVRFNAEGIAGLHDQPRLGCPAGMDEGRQAALKAMILRGPDPERDEVSSWCIVDLCRLAEQRPGVSYRPSGLLRLVTASSCSAASDRARCSTGDIPRPDCVAPCAPAPLTRLP